MRIRAGAVIEPAQISRVAHVVLRVEIDTVPAGWELHARVQAGFAVRGRGPGGGRARQVGTVAQADVLHRLGF